MICFSECSFQTDQDIMHILMNWLSPMFYKRHFWVHPRIIDLQLYSCVDSLIALEAGKSKKGMFHLYQSLPGFLCSTMISHRKHFLTWWPWPLTYDLDLWPWHLTNDLDLLTWPSYRYPSTWPTCQTSSLYVCLFSHKSRPDRETHYRTMSKLLHPLLTRGVKKEAFPNVAKIESYI